MPAKLENASIVFNTTDEDKDHDTALTVMVTDYDQQNVASAWGCYGHFNDRSTYTIQMTVLNQAPMDLLDRGTIRIHIDPNGHDTWRFNYILTLLFDDGSSYSSDAYDTELSQNNQDLIAGLKGRMHRGVGSTSSPISMNLTGIWQCDDGGYYYIRQEGDKIEWYGEEGKMGAPAWSNVATGTFSVGNITLEYADVPKGRALGHGTLKLEQNSPDTLIAKEKIGGFSGSNWWRKKN